MLIAGARHHFQGHTPGRSMDNEKQQMYKSYNAVETFSDKIGLVSHYMEARPSFHPKSTLTPDTILCVAISRLQRSILLQDNEEWRTLQDSLSPLLSA